LSACGGGAEDVPVAPTTVIDSGTDPGTPRDGGSDAGKKDASSDAAAGDSSIVNDELGPDVEFVTPTATTDPKSKDVITASTLNVRCKVTDSKEAGASTVDESTPTIVLENPKDPTILITSPTTSTTNDHEYQATFELTTLPNGLLRFHCSAKDHANPVRTGSATLETLLDLGPAIEITAPKATVYAYHQAVSVDFQVTASPVSDGDDSAGVTNVKLTVQSMDFPVTEDAMMPGHYLASIQFDDSTIFKTQTTNAQLIITATNSRTPTPITRKATVDISLDGDGPTITVQSPRDGDIQRGTVPVLVRIEDPSNVNVSSITAKIGGGLAILKDWDSSGAPIYKNSFDTLQLDGNHRRTQLIFNITAQDAVGNERTTGDLTVKLDNLPPVVSLDPPLIREWRKQDDTYYCSDFFDPVGTDVPDDLEAIKGGHHYRALIEDRTNQPLTDDSNVVAYLSGTDTTSVEMYTQPASDAPFIVDSDGKDGFCDEIKHGIEMEDAAKGLVVQGLKAVNPGGNARYPYIAKSDPMAASSCYQHVDTYSFVKQPDPICMQSPMIRVVPGRIVDRPPAVYGVRPTNGASECTGEAWELLNGMNEGWLCVAARAVDNKGNVGISEPLRLCYDDPLTNTLPDCWAACSSTSSSYNADTCAKSAPSCTDHCTFTDEQRFHFTELLSIAGHKGDDYWYIP
jgi:hypothetical protein